MCLQGHVRFYSEIKASFIYNTTITKDPQYIDIGQ